MKRNLSEIAGKKFDIVVVGGGIFGACIAWDASLRGLSVALVEKGDFGAATSASCFRIVHGGIRYLQHGDIWRTREAIRERRALLRIAPHLVRPAPVAIPTYGSGSLSKVILRMGSMAYDAVALDRNRGILGEAHRIPSSTAISRQECITRFPGLRREKLTGAVIIHEGQMRSPTRLILEFVRSAVTYGAEAANYVTVTGLLRKRDRILGVRAIDSITGNKFELLASTVVNATGPWAAQTLSSWLDRSMPENPMFSRDMFLVAARDLLPGEMGVAIPARSRDPGAILSRGQRHLFVLPHPNSTFVGVWHKAHRAAPDNFDVDDGEVREAIDEVNDSYGSALISHSSIQRVEAGLIPIRGTDTTGSQVDFGRRSIIVDHAATDQIEGLMTVVGVRYTTARHVAEEVVNRAFVKAGYSPPPCQTDRIPLVGGQTGRLTDFVRSAEQSIKSLGIQVDPKVVHTLVHNYGAHYMEVVRFIKKQPQLSQSINGSSVTGAEVLHVTRNEMAMKLEDLVLRRTELGSNLHAGDEALMYCANLMAEEHSWSAERIQQECDMTSRALNGIGSDSSLKVA